MALIGGASALFLGGFNNGTAASTLTNGLAAWYKCNGNTNDSSGYGNNGTWVGTTAYVADQNGIPNGACSFDGSSQIDVSGTSATTSAMSMSAWVYNKMTSCAGVAGNIVSTNYYPGWRVRTCSSGLVNVLNHNSGVAGLNVNSGVTANAWTFVTVTADSTGYKIYENGNFVGGTTTPFVATTLAAPLVIGALQTGSNSESFVGALSDIRIYNRAISSTEVNQLYTGGQHVDLSKGLVGWWKLNDNIKDSSPYRTKLSNINGVTYTTDRKGTANNAMLFNGTSNYLQSSNTTNSTKLTISGNVTLSSWIDPTAYNLTESHNLQNIIIANTDSAFATTNYAMSAPDATHVEFIKRNSGESLQTNAFVVPSLTSHWSLVTMSISGTTATLYVNGNLIGSQTIGGATITSAGLNGQFLSIGGNTYRTNCDFTGSISDVRIYSRTLNQSEVTALYQQYNPSLNLDSGQAGLVGWWKLNGNTKDSSPYRDNGVIQGSGVSYVVDRKNAANGAISFDGTSGGYVQIPSKPWLGFSTGNLSYSVWFKVNALGTSADGAEQIFRSGSVASSGYELQIESNGAIGANPGGGSTVDSSPGLITANKWYNITVARSGTSSEVYLNSTPVYTITSSGSTSGSSIAIGADVIHGSENFNGSVSDLRIYSRALSATEISTLYKSYNPTLNVDTTTKNINLSSGLVGYWAMNGNPNDSTPYRNNGAIVGSVSLTSDRKGRPNSAYVFNSTSTSQIRIAGMKNLPNNSSPQTYSVWFKLDTTNSSGPIMTIHYNGSNIGEHIIASTTGLAVGRYGGGNAIVPTTAASIASNTWHMFTYTWDGTTATVYLDGTFFHSSTANPPTPGPLNEVDVSGYYNGTYNAFWNGSIDDVHIYNRALSTQEVQALYNEYN